MIITYYGYLFLAYVLLCLFYTLNLVAKEKSKYKLFNFAIIFWFMTRQVYKSPYAWREFSVLAKFRKADQLLAWFLLAYLVLSYLSNDESRTRLKLLVYEKYVYAYYFFAIAMLYLHRNLGNITYARAMQTIYAYIAAVIMFFSLKRFIGKEFVRMMAKATLFLSVLSGFVSVFQFFGDQKIMRLAAYYMAFPGYNRASGIFHWPYDNGIILITGMMLSIYLVKSIKKRILINIVLIIAIILTYTRGVWLAGFVVIIYHFYVFDKKALRRGILVISLGSLLTFGLVAAYAVHKDFFTGEAWQERVFKDTVSVRFAFYDIVFRAIPDSWLIGYGDLQNNDVYFKGMVNAGQGLYWSLGRGGGIHNVFLEELFLRGIFSALFWILSFVTMFYFSTKQAIKYKNFSYCFPLYYNMAVFFYSTSVGAFLTSRSGYQTIIFFAMLSAIYNKKIHLEEFQLTNLISVRENKRYRVEEKKLTESETIPLSHNEV